MLVRGFSEGGGSGSEPHPRSCSGCMNGTIAWPGVSCRCGRARISAFRCMLSQPVSQSGSGAGRLVEGVSAERLLADWNETAAIGTDLHE